MRDARAPHTSRFPHRIKVVACVEGKLWSDYRNSTKPPFYRGSRTPRPDYQFKSERRVLEALVPRGLLVGRVARVEEYLAVLKIDAQARLRLLRRIECREARRQGFRWHAGRVGKARARCRNSSFA